MKQKLFNGRKNTKQILEFLDTIDTSAVIPISLVRILYYKINGKTLSF